MMQKDMAGIDTPGSAPESETLHRAVLSVAFLLSIFCLFLTYLGIDTYIESGRSLFGDTRTSIGYQWKEDSCDLLFRGYLSDQAPQRLRDRSADICRIARNRDLPPIALKSVIGKAPYAAESTVASGGGHDVTESFMNEVRASLTRQLPMLESLHAGHRRMISYMWFFFPGVLGVIGCYFYARRSTPALFAVITRRFEHIMYDRNRYSDAFDNLINTNKRR